MGKKKKAAYSFYPFYLPHEVFNDIQHYKTVRTNIINALKKGFTKKNKSIYLLSDLHKHIVIEFSTKIEREEVFLDPLNNQIIILAPKISKETEDEKRDRTMYYHKFIVCSFEEMIVRGITEIYLSLSKKGRDQISKVK